MFHFFYSASGPLALWLKTKLNVCFQDNVFVNVVASIQYRALADKAGDAFYKLSNTKGQIQAYVFDGTYLQTIITLQIIMFLLSF